MPYAPVINELGPRLIMGGYEGEANARLAGAQAVGDNIISAASGVSGGVGKAMLTQQEIQQLSGKVQAMHESGMIGEEDVAKFNSASLGSKRGMVGEWDASANLLRQKELDTFRTGNDMTRDSNMIGAQGANAATLAQLKAGVPEAPKYDRVTLEDGRVAFVAPNAPAVMATDDTGKPLKAAQNVNPLAALLGGGGAPAAPAPDAASAQPGARPAVGGYQVGRRYNGMTYLGGDPNDQANWQ